MAASSALIADCRTWPLAFDLYLPVSWTEDAEDAPPSACHQKSSSANSGASRWPIEPQYRELKDDLSLDQFEGRSYSGCPQRSLR